MFEWIYDMLMSFVSFVLSLLGISENKKSVHFADDVQDTQEKQDSDNKAQYEEDPPQTEKLLE